MIRVLVVEDTPVVREFLVHIFSSDPGILVVGTAANGEEALDAVLQTKPDVITMDIHMPKLNGLDATRRIMETHPTPIVIVSGSANTKEASWAFTALEAGALAVVERPAGIGHPGHQQTAAELIQTVRLMSEVRVVRRWPRPLGSRVGSSAPPSRIEVTRPFGPIKVAAIGASTGGPPVLQKILSELVPDLPFPVLVVQHISPGFGEGLTEWLAQTSSLPVHIASHGGLARPGHVYMARDGFHLGISGEGKLLLTEDPPEHGHRPSVSYLFRAVEKAFGSRTTGVLLTGMGKDGAAELTAMKNRGAITIVQDKDSCVVHGMPGEAIQLGGASFVLPPHRMAAALARLGHSNRKADL